MTPESPFEERRLHFCNQAKVLDSRMDRIAWLRLVLAIMGVFSLWKGLSTGEMAYWINLGTVLMGFALVVKWNGRLESKKRLLVRLAKINEQEAQRLIGISPDGFGGESYNLAGHPFSDDLDLFGVKSVYSLLNRSGTESGRKKLAEWLLVPADLREILSRQAAVAELEGSVEFRQQLQAKGWETSFSDPVKSLQSWLTKDAALQGKEWMPLAGLCMSVLLFILTGLAAFGVLSWWIPGGLFLIHHVLNLFLSRTMASQHVLGENISKSLASHSDLFREISISTFQTDKINHIKSVLSASGLDAASEIKSLSNIVQRFELRLNVILHFVLNNMLFWDLHAMAALDKWRKSKGKCVEGWFDALGEMEALCGMAAWSFGESDSSMPKFVNGDFVVKSESMGHPLVPKDVRVCNPVNLDGNGQVTLITGSNMSGKSTYLRTVGVNVALAMIGAPVLATEMTLSPTKLVASMRVSDSLEDSTSSFYAELKRIKLVIQTTEEGGNTIFLLDEILKGTNSQDRHAGARALIAQLIGLGGSGLVSTHDLELQDLEKMYLGKVINKSFSCQIAEDGSLGFDYRLHAGVCQSMNATALMRAMGIRL
jgi:hypothetical protein